LKFSYRVFLLKTIAIKLKKEYFEPYYIESFQEKFKAIPFSLIIDTSFSDQKFICLEDKILRKGIS